MIINKYRKGFTLIELLVVISIIGLLSSVVLASLQSARQKGIVGATIQFADHNYHKLGANTLFSANFNEGSGVSIPQDQTGNYSAGVATITHSSNTPFSDSGYSFNNTATGLQFVFTSSNAVALPDTSGVAASAWFNLLSVTPATAGSVITAPVNYTSLRPLNIRVTSSGAYCLTAGVVTPVYYAFTIDSNWHNITCNYDSSTSLMNVYFDGKLVIPNVTASGYGNPQSLNTTVILGASVVGLIDNAQVFSGSLLASEVQKLYAEGLKTHQVASLIK